ncbi:ornithine cyclodeaminase family protein [Agromyces laixinhei]|uniref:ornithine cyclodeaminase family protein n=1 Tax=Agromyces laixinhei TaxID=2585717 RepID=UPI0018DE008F|nr:ornithine cyclodeaminase family protein [Agromyces laixinhei]
MVAPASLPYIDGDAARAALPLRDAIDAVARVLAVIDADAQPARTSTALSRGQFLLMPGELGEFAGCKVLTVAEPGLAQAPERIQGMMLLFDARSLAPVAVLDGAALTALRTPAVSAAIVDLVTPADASTVAVFGTGPQARAHIEAIRAIRPVARTFVVGRTADRTAAAAAKWSDHRLAVIPARPDIVAECDIVVCATTAAAPVLTSGSIGPRTTVVAVGSHEPHRRELPGELLGRSQVLVEGRRVALSEAGDVIMAIAEGELDESDLVTFRDIATGSAEIAFDKPRVVKTCGMVWQDVVIAAAVAARRGIRLREGDLG